MRPRSVVPVSWVLQVSCDVAIGATGLRWLSSARGVDNKGGLYGLTRYLHVGVVSVTAVVDDPAEAIGIDGIFELPKSVPGQVSTCAAATISFSGEQSRGSRGSR